MVSQCIVRIGRRKRAARVRAWRNGSVRERERERGREGGRRGTYIKGEKQGFASRLRTINKLSTHVRILLLLGMVNVLFMNHCSLPRSWKKDCVNSDITFSVRCIATVRRTARNKAKWMCGIYNSDISEERSDTSSITSRCASHKHAAAIYNAIHLEVINFLHNPRLSRSGSALHISRMKSRAWMEEKVWTVA